MTLGYPRNDIDGFGVSMSHVRVGVKATAIQHGFKL